MRAPWDSSLTLHGRACFAPLAAIPAWVAAASAAASAAVGAVGVVSAGEAQANAAKYDAAVDRNNSIQAQQAADAQSLVVEQQTKQKLGAQAAAYAASGVDVHTGTPVDVMTNTAAQGRLDALTVRYGGKVTGLGDVQAATLAQYQGSQAATAADLGAGSTLLTGGVKAGQIGGYFAVPGS